MRLKKLTCLLSFVLPFVSFAVSAIDTFKVDESTYVLYVGENRGVNMVVNIGDDGVLLVDSMGKNEAVHDELLKAIRAISAKPVKYLINTDSDFVHKKSYTYFSNLGATIVAQQDGQLDPGINAIRYKESMTITFNNQNVEISSVNATSFDDSLVFFDKSNVLAMGNIYSKKSIPVFWTGGYQGFDCAVERAISIANSDTVIVPSHGKVDNIVNLQKFRSNAKEMMKRLYAMKLQGVSNIEMAKDTELNEIWSRFNSEKVNDFMSDSFKLKMIGRFISTDFVTKFPLSDFELNRFVGDYKYSAEGSGVRVIKRGSSIFSIDAYGMQELIPQSESEFHVRASISDNVIFLFDAKGNVSGFDYISNEKKYPAKKLNL